MKDTKTRITFEYEGTPYTLEYTASSLKQLERQGFSLGKIDENAVSANEELFAGAFLANHQYVPKRKRLEIYKELCESDENGDKLMEVINNMIAEALEELNTHKGNVKWTVLN